MNITEGRCYSVAEIRRWLFDAGFECLEHKPTAVSRSFIVAQKL
jgi:hypothetical protein